MTEVAKCERDSAPESEKQAGQSLLASADSAVGPHFLFFFNCPVVDIFLAEDVHYRLHAHVVALDIQKVLYMKVMQIWLKSCRQPVTG